MKVYQGHWYCYGDNRIVLYLGKGNLRYVSQFYKTNPKNKYFYANLKDLLKHFKVDELKDVSVEKILELMVEDKIQTNLTSKFEPLYDLGEQTYSTFNGCLENETETYLKEIEIF